MKKKKQHLNLEEAAAYINEKTGESYSAMDVLEHSIEGSLTPRVSINKSNKVDTDSPVVPEKYYDSMENRLECVGDIDAPDNPYDEDQKLLMPTQTTLAELISGLEYGIPLGFQPEDGMLRDPSEVYFDTCQVKDSAQAKYVIQLEENVSVLASGPVSLAYTVLGPEGHAPLVYLLENIEAFVNSHEGTNISGDDSPVNLSAKEKRQLVFNGWSFDKELDENGQFKFTKEEAWNQLNQIDKKTFPPLSPESIKDFFNFAAPNKFRRGRPRGK